MGFSTRPWRGLAEELPASRRRRLSGTRGLRKRPVTGTHVYTHRLIANQLYHGTNCL
jgi:hypothetical protein